MSVKNECNKKNWTDKQLTRLHEASILYTNKTLFRMKRIANYVGDGYTYKQCREALWVRKYPILNNDKALTFEPTFSSYEKYPFGPDGNPIDNILKWNSCSKWTEELDEKLSAAMKIFPKRSKNCNRNIAKFIGGGISEIQVRDRKTNGLFVYVPEPKQRWTREMDSKLIQAVQQCTRKRGIHWPSVNKVMNMHNKQAHCRWHLHLAKQLDKTNMLTGTSAIVIGKNLREGNSKSVYVSEAEDYLSESDYWVDVSDPATTKRLNRRKRNRDLFYEVWNSSGSVGGSVGSDRLVGKVIDIDRDYCNSSVCSDDLISVPGRDISSGYPAKRNRSGVTVAGDGESNGAVDKLGDAMVDCDGDNDSVDFENYVTISDELIDMLGLYDSSSGESDCE